jgi:hypothetical protein
MATDFLLTGRDGNGKSSVGNSILNQQAFNTRSNSNGPQEIIKRSGNFEGRTVNISDGFSIRDNSSADKDNVLATIGLAEKAVASFLNGFSVLLFVLKYGVRFTQQERTAVSTIRCLFGDNIFKNHGIVVLTNGDSFEKDMEEEGSTFEAWCRQQSGDVKELFRECGDRYVLFNNRAKDNGQMKEQVRKLMTKADEVQSRGSRYTLDTFRNARSGQRKLLVGSKLPELQRETSRFLDGITQSVRKLDDSYYKPIDCIQELTALKQSIDNFKAYLEEEDEGTNSIGQLKLQISVTEAGISTKKERSQRKIEFESILPRSRTPPLGATDSAISTKYILIGGAGLVFIIIIIILIYY